MATVEQCELALRRLAARLSDNNGHSPTMDFERSLTCTIRDLDVVFAGRLKNGQLIDIGRANNKSAQVKLAMSSDDLLALVDGKLKMAAAWATGRVRVDAGIRDMLKLRSIF